MPKESLLISLFLFLPAATELIPSIFLHCVLVGVIAARFSSSLALHRLELALHRSNFSRHFGQSLLLCGGGGAGSVLLHGLFAAERLRRLRSSQMACLLESESFPKFLQWPVKTVPSGPLILLSGTPEPLPPVFTALAFQLGL
jgi:hypothetical protein